jgi:uncharacterized protein YndB with AHSA1/START domain
MAAASPQALTTLHIERTFAASRERVFDAWTDPELLARWLTPPGGSSSNAEVDLRVGGSWSITMKPPLWPSGRAFGTYLEVDPPVRLVFTIAWERMPNGPQSLVRVDFDELDGATRVTLVQERLETRRGRWAHKRGWRHSLECLREVVEASAR